MKYPAISPASLGSPLPPNKASKIFLYLLNHSFIITGTAFLPFVNVFLFFLLTSGRFSNTYLLFYLSFSHTLTSSIIIWFCLYVCSSIKPNIGAVKLVLYFYLLIILLFLQKIISHPKLFLSFYFKRIQWHYFITSKYLVDIYLSLIKILYHIMLT